MPTELNADTMAPLRADIRKLGEILGAVIQEQVSQEFFELEEQIRELCKQARAKKEEDLNLQIETLISAQTPETLVYLAKTFGLYFQLVNLAEQRHRIRRKKEYERQGNLIKYSLEYASSKLKHFKAEPELLRKQLAQFQIVPVMTAHPTHIMRKTTVNKHRRITEILFQRDLPQSPKEAAQLDMELKHEITLLWQSNPFHIKKVSVTDEAENLFLYFENALWEILPKLYNDLEYFLKQEDIQIQLPSMLRFGSWIGGDRDGHPFVTATVTQTVLQEQKNFVLRKYEKTLAMLEDHLSSSLMNQTVSANFLDSLLQDKIKHPEIAQLLIQKYPQELYRQKLGFIKYKLANTSHMNYHPEQNQLTNYYHDAQALKQELELLLQSLEQNKAQSAGQPLKDFIRQVETFDFCLATLDIRQHAAVHAQAIQEIFEQTQVCSDYLQLSESEKQKLLLQELRNPRPLLSPFQVLSEPSQELLNTLHQIRKSRETISKKAIENYIISTCAKASDILHLLLLFKETGLASFQAENRFCELNLIPLFETVADLKDAPQIMESLYQLEEYRDLIRHKKNTQEIMLGYSDSAKEAGILAASWHLYQTQQNLMKVSQKYQINLRFFHGRGGTISRGGGPSHHAILAQPPETVQGDIRITEQGEVLSWKYMFPEMAHRNLSVLFSALTEVCLLAQNTPKTHEEKSWALLESLAQKSYHKYRQLVESPDFIVFFKSATPLESISHLNIGSRPSSRKKSDRIEDLRAIPWVFSWMQSRCVMPAWYGVGSAFEDSMNNSEQKKLIQKMYQEWPFFQVLIDNLQMTLSKADMNIASGYANLAPLSTQKSIWLEIRAEYLKTCQVVLEITGQIQILEKSPVLQKSIALRNPYVDPLNYIQLDLLKRLREKTHENTEQTQLKQALNLSIMGISEGLRNTG
ncbi:phosphoenolpyruvate carboxylase [bacterium (Candidatus Blackallbacteria) CG17_big_fil_post_rev_8_21_14_2_50_48_46]|uniref:Phosphoenolpyruvate carboxylase n=1 Tax=bacterium (Candidatus Blackallbacteria) CG17_big_fil_post_rev_8_21_14_2_50_48_46 TaxID=2014261 RepID=A0A2M7GB09_9BACT|nr:MAG: phosphoenolpyruvate carboxylase [bacterium (Candidatus Blackallbacteria) CG18_big_fil_WC_8_21_14_2_50_49_26]PIW19362.1 MAG: phosphoenolpyruvate carboxylase [bacterium (Candidatus Blackallbacteria) CG17_big_fil_post_rev_8_21_14_2_50_48_46]PIW49034.1 MAG: phosphoenolpyruvate carboxylase [bacterium (Candidatus Blackallbacteria) CG13_big_fil_rev_8_21_14_2_50_49_14]